MSSAPPTLRPREHGAYAMLAFPILSGLVLGGASVGGVSFALLAAAGFLGHEAVGVVLGRRGERLRSAAERAARRRLAVVGTSALAAGIAFALTSSRGTLLWAAPTAVLGTAVGTLLMFGRTKSLPGELLVAAAFASVHAPVAAAGGAAPAAAAVPALVWAASFTLATLSVHALKARFRRRRMERGGAEGGDRWLVGAAPLAAAATLGVGAAALAMGWTVVGRPLGAPAAALAPKALLVLAVAALDVHPRHLKRVGWSLVAADLATLVVLGAGLARD